MRSRQARAVTAQHFATNDQVTAYPYTDAGRPFHYRVIGVGREHPGGGPGVVCADRRDSDLVLVHPWDLFHPDDTCAQCAADRARMVSEHGEAAAEGTGTDPSDMTLARTEDGVLWHIDDWLAYYDGDVEYTE